MKVLLVEDNRMIQEVLSHQLRMSGYTVVIAQNGREGVTMAAEERPLLILMDMGLPILDGWEATREIKANSALSHIPIIAMSGHSEAPDRQACEDAGCDGFEPKPIHFGRLMDTMARLGGQV